MYNPDGFNPSNSKKPDNITQLLTKMASKKYLNMSKIPDAKKQALQRKLFNMTSKVK